MKKISIVVLALCTFTAIATAQIGISKGIMGGLNLSNVGGSDAPTSEKSLTGYAGGIFVEIDLPGPFSIEPEARSTA